MTEEARKRMWEMKARAEENPMPPVPSFVRTPNGTQATPTPSQPPSPKGFRLLQMLNLDRFKTDPDVSVILMLVLLLSGEDCDELLLLALVYILL